MKPPAKKRTKWFTSAQIRGYMAHLKYAIEHSPDGAYAQLDLTTSKRLLEICQQAKHTEEGYGL